MISFWGYELLPQRKVVSRILEGIPKKISAAVSKIILRQPFLLQQFRQSLASFSQSLFGFYKLLYFNPNQPLEYPIFVVQLVCC